MTTPIPCFRCAAFGRDGVPATTTLSLDGIERDVCAACAEQHNLAAELRWQGAVAAVCGMLPADRRERARTLLEALRSPDAPAYTGLGYDAAASEALHGGTWEPSRR